MGVPGVLQRAGRDEWIAGLLLASGGLLALFLWRGTAWADWLFDLEDRRGIWELVTGLLMPAFVGVGGLAVAAASWSSSYEATRIANDAADAEVARGEEDTKRTREERAERYALRFTDALVHTVRLVDEATRTLLLRKSAEDSMNLQLLPDRKRAVADAMLAASNELMILKVLANDDDRPVVKAAVMVATVPQPRPTDDTIARYNTISSALLAWAEDGREDPEGYQEALMRRLPADDPRLK